MNISAQKTAIEDAIVFTPRIFEDPRGFFMEVYRDDYFRKIGVEADFVQVNLSYSVKDVVRGLHFQWDPPMGKLMRVISGKAFLVAVDIRKDSRTLGKWIGIEASSENRKQLWAPAGFARGFYVLSPTAEIEYFCTGIYNPSAESGIAWNDPEIGIDWPVEGEPILSEKDANAQTLSDWLKRPESESFRCGM